MILHLLSYIQLEKELQLPRWKIKLPDKVKHERFQRLSRYVNEILREIKNY